MVEHSVCSLTITGVVSLLGRSAFVIDSAAKSVFIIMFLICWSHMVGNVQPPNQVEGTHILAPHHVEPLQLDTEDQRRLFDLALLYCRNFLLTLSTFVFTQTFFLEKTRKSIVNIIRMSASSSKSKYNHRQILFGFFYPISSWISVKCCRVDDTLLQRRHITSWIRYPPKIWLKGVVSLEAWSIESGTFIERR